MTKVKSLSHCRAFVYLLWYRKWCCSLHFFKKLKYNFRSFGWNVCDYVLMFALHYVMWKLNASLYRIYGMNGTAKSASFAHFCSMRFHTQTTEKKLYNKVHRVSRFSLTHSNIQACHHTDSYIPWQNIEQISWFKCLYSKNYTIRYSCALVTHHDIGASVSITKCCYVDCLSYPYMWFWHIWKDILNSSLK